MNVLKDLEIPSVDGVIRLQIALDRPVFIVGGNGTGKSALVWTLYSRIGVGAVYIPGTRPCYLDHENLSFTPAARKSHLDHVETWNRAPRMRWSPIGGTQRNEKALHDLQTLELGYKLNLTNQIAIESRASEAIDTLQSRNSHLDRANAIFKRAGIPINIIIHEGELYAERDGSKYTVSKMSDGERSALILIAEVFSVPASSCL